MFERTLATIPLASQTFSKSAMQLVVGASPLFIERGDGCTVWDVDGNQYIDFVLGLLPVVLGYRDPDVDTAIAMQLERGITLSLSSPLEVELAELLVSIIPCAEMVRFGKNGSDVTSAAIRIARAATGRERVVACGYHGWHDWYIGSTTRSLGVPTAVRSLTSTFPFNDADGLEGILDRHPDEIAAVILEPAGVVEPESGFLPRVRELTDQHGVVLIFDEIVTGFRLALGGAQEYYGVVPDLATFGKAMGNGMPISAIVGRRDLMVLMEDIFYSGTFAGETLSLAAALATIRKIMSSGTIAAIHGLGQQLSAALGDALAQRGLEEHLRLTGPLWWPRVTATPDGPTDPRLTTSLLRQELFDAGILSLGSLNLCLAHTTGDSADRALSGWRTAFDEVASALTSAHPEACLRGSPIRPVFDVRTGPVQ